jgi:dihydrofolate synthase/folylpolyglutamate synthase
MTDRSYESLLTQRLAAYRRFGVNLGLERIQRLLTSLGNPEAQVPIVHVAGTNGKGSVCAYLASILSTAGYRVGRYTSPHLVSWTERICINGQAIAPHDLMAALDQVEAVIDQSQETPTQFEVFTAAAWLFFAQQQVDMAVIEVGLGGRLDATNVVEQPLVTVITTLSREHCQVLGPTVADIAREKAGILKRDRPVVMGALAPDAGAVVLARAQALNCPVIRPQPATFDTEGYACYLSDQKFCLKYILPFPGEHQLMNSTIAIAAAHSLREQGWYLPDTVIQQGLEQAQWPGRLQWVMWRSLTGQTYPWLLDGAHNPAAAGVLRDYVTAIAQPDVDPITRRTLRSLDLPLPLPNHTTWVMGMLTTKDHADVLRALLRPGDYLHLVPVPDHAAMTPEALRDIALTACPGLAACSIYDSLAAGLQGAITDPPPLRVLCGSLYLVGHFLGTQPYTPPLSHNQAP